MKKSPDKNSEFPENKQPQSRFFNLLSKGTQALHDGDIAKAIRLLERAHELDQENIDAALNLGGAYILSKKFSKAAAILEPLSERDPHNPMVWTNLGAAYLGNPILAKDEDHQRAGGCHALLPGTVRPAHDGGAPARIACLVRPGGGPV